MTRNFDGALFPRAWCSRVRGMLHASTLVVAYSSPQSTRAWAPALPVIPTGCSAQHTPKYTLDLSSKQFTNSRQASKQAYITHDTSSFVSVQLLAYTEGIASVVFSVACPLTSPLSLLCASQRAKRGLASCDVLLVVSCACSCCGGVG